MARPAFATASQALILTRAASKLRGAPLIPLLIIVVFLFTAVFAPFMAPYSATEGELSEKLQPPFWEQGGSTAHLLGTDKMGRDIASRIIYGARVSLTVSLIAIFCGALVGTALGLVSGYFRGWIDAAIMRTADAMLALPLILLALILVAVLGQSMTNIMLVVALGVWARYARMIRGEALSVRERDFVALARVAGCSHQRIMLAHILPNVANTLIVLITLQIGWVILLEASLSFLGMGVPPPQPAWGLMVADGRDFVTSAWWVSFFPGLAIVAVVMALNLFGDWLRDVLDPRRRQI